MNRDTKVEVLAYTLAEAAQALRISRAQAYRLAASGELRTVVVGQRMRVPMTALEDLLAAPR